MQALVFILLLSLTKYCSSEKTLDDIVLVNNKLHNQTLHRWSSPYLSTLNLSLEISPVVVFNKFLERMEPGLLSKNMDERELLKSEDESTLKRKVWIYDARNQVVDSMLVKMGVFELHCFRRPAEILVELKIDAQKDYVVTIFLSKPNGESIPLRIPGCFIPCSLGLFELLARNVIPDKWNYHCIDRIGDISILVCETIALVVVILIIFFIRKQSRDGPAMNVEPRRIPERNANMDAVIEVIDERYKYSDNIRL